MKTLNDIQRAFDVNGFVLARNKKHLVYKRGPLTITMAKTPSDARAYENIYSYMKRELRRNNLEVIEESNERKKEKKVNQLNAFTNQPTLIEDQGRKIKKLDTVALDLCRKWKEEGLDQRQMAEHLNKIGYTSRTGVNIDQSCISKFLITNGVRTFSARGKNKKQHADGFLTKLADVLSSNIGDENKEELIEMLVEKNRREKLG